MVWAFSRGSGTGARRTFGPHVPSSSLCTSFQTAGPCYLTVANEVTRMESFKPQRARILLQENVTFSRVCPGFMVQGNASSFLASASFPAGRPPPTKPGARGKCPAVSTALLSELGCGGSAPSPNLGDLSTLCLPVGRRRGLPQPLQYVQGFAQKNVLGSSICKCKCPMGEFSSHT